MTESRVLFNSYRVQSDLYAAEANIRDFRGVARRSGTRGEDRYQRRVQDPTRVRALVVDQDSIRHHRRAAQTPRGRSAPRWGTFLCFYFISYGQLKSSRLVFCSIPVQFLFNSCSTLFNTHRFRTSSSTKCTSVRWTLTFCWCSYGTSCRTGRRCVWC